MPRTLIRSSILALWLAAAGVLFAGRALTHSGASRPTAAPHAPDISSGLMAYYRLDGDASDSSGNAHHGTPSAGISFGPGRAGQAAFFPNLTEQRISIPDHETTALPAAPGSTHPSIGATPAEAMPITICLTPDRPRPGPHLRLRGCLAARAGGLCGPRLAR